MTFRIEVATWENGGYDWIFNSAKKEGWEPGLDDMNMFPLLDQNVFFIGFC